MLLPGTAGSRLPTLAGRPARCHAGETPAVPGTRLLISVEPVLDSA